MENPKLTWSEAELREAAGQAVEAMLQALPRPVECDHVFSQDFCEKMDRLVQREKTTRKKRHTRTRVAAAIAAVLIGLATWLAVDAEARERVFRWFSERIGSSVVYHFPDETPAENRGVYAPAWIPEGFTEARRNCTKDHGSIYYTDENADMEILFNYDAVNEYTYDGLEGVKSDPEIIYVQGHRGEYYVGSVDSPMNVLIWFDEKAGILFSVDGTAEKDVMLHIAESINMVEMPKS